MTERVQPGAEIDSEVWQEFREEVIRRRGGTRGHLRNELENALRAYIQAGDATPSEIDARLQRIEAAVGAAPTDGGSIASDDEHTHTDDSEHDVLDERPRPKSNREKKNRWLAQRVRDAFGGGEQPEQISRDDLIGLVKDEYQFRSDTSKSYVSGLIDHFGFVEHPRTSEVLVTEKVRREMLEAEAEEKAQALEESEEGR